MGHEAGFLRGRRRIDERAGVPETDEIFVVVRQEMNQRGREPPDWTVSEPVGLFPHRHLLQVLLRGFEPRPGLTQGEARPPGEVPGLRWTVAGEVTTGQLGQSFVLVELLPAGRDPVVQQRVGELLAAQGTAADDRVQLGLHHQVAQALSVGLDSHAPVDLRDLRAGQVNAAPHGLEQSRMAPREDGRVERQLPIVVAPWRRSPGAR